MQPIHALIGIAAAGIIGSTVVQCSTEHDVTLQSLNCRNPQDVSPNNIKKIEKITGGSVFQICEMKGIIGRSGDDGLIIKMTDGKEYYSRHKPDRLYDPKLSLQVKQ